ncbi:MAG: DNA methyltransferase [Halobacteriota archaeon]
MRTDHRIVVGDARDLETVDDDSVELVVTSPPYPMIEMWDEVFAELDPRIDALLEAGRGRAAFDRMHAALEPAWAEVARVLVDGGIACVNVGDATRSLDGAFRVYQNHARVIEVFEALGFEPLPEILWRKPTNAATKFMGSGMLPPNAYVTLEHEYILPFRLGSTPRSFEAGADRRYRAAYFWEERNRWFSDVWTDVRGEQQPLGDGAVRERSAAYPLAIPFRLVSMFSVYGDTVLDPFWGTGTTTIASMVAGRHSVGIERDPGFVEAFHDRVEEVPHRSRRLATRRLADHVAFVERERAAGRSLEYRSDAYGVPVRTAQERRLELYAVDRVEPTDDGYRAHHRRVDLPREIVEGDGNRP